MLIRFIFLSVIILVFTVRTGYSQQKFKGGTIAIAGVSLPVGKLGQNYSTGFMAGFNFNFRKPIGKSSANMGFETSMQAFTNRYNGRLNWFNIFIRPDLKFYFQDKGYIMLAAGSTLLTSGGLVDFGVNAGAGAGVFPVKNKALQFFVRYDLVNLRSTNIQAFSIGAGYRLSKKSQ